MQLRRGGEGSGRRTDKERRTGLVDAGRVRRLIPVAALALAGGTQDRCRGERLVVAPTTQRTIMVGRFDLP
jgi:hypothetical protein